MKNSIVKLIRKYNKHMGNEKKLGDVQKTKKELMPFMICVIIVTAIIIASVLLLRGAKN